MDSNLPSLDAGQADDRPTATTAVASADSVQEAKEPAVDDKSSDAQDSSSESYDPGMHYRRKMKNEKFLTQGCGIGTKKANLLEAHRFSIL